jgi:hypothetical protein
MRFYRGGCVLGVVLLLLSLSNSAGAQRHYEEDSRWENLGRAYVDGRVDHDRIVVNEKASFRALQLGVKGGTIEFQRVVVHFENGADHQLDIRERIPEHGKTRVIDLPGDRRHIRSVEFWYAKEHWRSKPYVNLWGRR